MAIGEWVYVDDANGTGVAGQLVVQSKTSGSLTLLNPSPSVSGVPLADTTQDGLLRKVSGLTTDFVDGTNNCQTLLPLAVSKLNTLSVSLEVVSTNQTVDCTGAVSVFVSLVYTAAITLNLTHLGQNTQVFLRLANQAATSMIIKVAGTGPTGTALSAVRCVLVSQGAEVDLITNGIGFNTVVTQYFQGMCYAGSQLFMMSL